MKTKRIQPRLYEVETTNGTYRIHKTRKHTSGFGPLWFVVNPVGVYWPKGWDTKDEALEYLTTGLEEE